MKPHIVERFHSRYIPVPESGCWLWEGPMSRYGYGVVSLGHSKKHTWAHRFSWQVHVGPIPDGLFVCHKCDTPACVNPDHLFLGTNAENMADKVKKGRNLGEWSGVNSLTNGQVIEIFNSPIPPYAIARKYGVSRITVVEIRNGTRWGHITSLPHFQETPADALRKLIEYSEVAKVADKRSRDPQEFKRAAADFIYRHGPELLAMIDKEERQ